MILSRTSLGQSPLHGSQAVEHCVQVKQALFRKLGHIDNAYLLTVPCEVRTCRLEACFVSGDAKAEAWAKEAEKLAPRAWERTAVKDRVR